MHIYMNNNNCQDGLIIKYYAISIKRTFFRKKTIVYVFSPDFAFLKQDFATNFVLLKWRQHLVTVLQPVVLVNVDSVVVAVNAESVVTLMSSTAWDTGILFMAASRLSCSFSIRCCTI